MQSKKSSQPAIVVIGATGFVGSYFLNMFKRFKTSLMSPSHAELNIIDKKNVETYFEKISPSFIINFAAYTNINEGEKEKKDRSRLTWLTNVVGVQNLVAICRKRETFLIQISTDAVFPGTKNNPGPYHENSKPAYDGKDINWYGYTKLKAEEEVKKLKNRFALLRISHPFGNPLNERDLIAKTLKDIEGKHAIFKDQLFTPTFLEDAASAIWAIQKNNISGIFHAGCKGLVSRIEFDRYLLKLLKNKAKLVEGSMEEFLKYSAPRTRLGGFLTDYTQKILGVKFHSWQGALDKTLLGI